MRVVRMERLSVSTGRWVPPSYAGMSNSGYGRAVTILVRILRRFKEKPGILNRWA